MAKGVSADAVKIIPAVRQRQSKNEARRLRCDITAPFLIGVGVCSVSEEYYTDKPPVWQENPHEIWGEKR